MILKDISKTLTKAQANKLREKLLKDILITINDQAHDLKIEAECMLSLNPIFFDNIEFIAKVEQYKETMKYYKDELNVEFKKIVKARRLIADAEARGVKK